MTTAIAVAYGDGDSPEHLEAALIILREAGADITVETIEVGKRIYDMDHPPGILPSAFDILNRTRILLKGRTQMPKEDYKDVSDVVRDYYGLSAENRILYDDTPIVAYIGETFALFESAEETAPAMIIASTYVLEHIGQRETAERIRSALTKTLAEGLPEKNLLQRIIGSEKSESLELAEAVCARLNADYAQLAS